MIIRRVKQEDAGPISEIYNHYVANTVITFEEQPVPEAEMRDRIKEISRDYPWFVAEDSVILGYAYASRFRPRSAYRFSAETTVYCNEKQQRKGIGTRLYTELLKALRETEVRVAYGSIALPNESSIRLHERFGFKKVAHLSNVGFKLGRWVDVGYWELQLKDTTIRDN